LPLAAAFFGVVSVLTLVALAFEAAVDLAGAFFFANGLSSSSSLSSLTFFLGAALAFLSFA